MTSPQKKILIVEDDTDTADMLSEMMRLSGHQVQKTTGSKTAVSLLAREKPDLVLLDLMLPDVSGLEVLQFMQRDPALVHIPVVVVTAKCLPSDIKKGLSAGATAYLTKPVAYQEIKGTVEAILRLDV